MNTPTPRIFEHFPKTSTCPICKTNSDEKCVLIPITGTEEDGIVQAQPFHLSCALIKQWDPAAGFGVTCSIYSNE